MPAAKAWALSIMSRGRRQSRHNWKVNKRQPLRWIIHALTTNCERGLFWYQRFSCWNRTTARTIHRDIYIYIYNTRPRNAHCTTSPSLPIVRYIIYITPDYGTRTTPPQYHHPSWYYKTTVCTLHHLSITTHPDITRLSHAHCTTSASPPILILQDYRMHTAPPQYHHPSWYYKTTACTLHHFSIITEVILKNIPILQDYGTHTAPPQYHQPSW